uniref:Uncharacterized protein n=1 Tax=Plectus sambesii TaxID=2011161 RepID=A0A914XDK0_9BILA
MRVLSILADDACSSSQTGQLWSDINLPSTVCNIANVTCPDESSLLLLNGNGSLIKQEQQQQNQQLQDDAANISSIIPNNTEFVKFSSISCCFGTNLAISSDGQLFAWGDSSFGQCGIVSAEAIAEPREVPLRGPATSCKHGRQTAAKSLHLKFVAAGERVVCVVDDADQIWTYGALRGDGVPLLDPIKLMVPPGRQVVSIVAGKRHFAALVRLKAKEEDADAVFQETDIPFKDDSATYCENCADCVADKRLRFSVLIQEANEKHAKTSFDRGAVLELRTEHPFCGEGLKLVLDVPSPTRKSERGGQKRRPINTAPTTVAGRGDDHRRGNDEQEPLLNRRNRSISDHFSFVSLDMLADTFADSDKDSSITTVSSGVGPSLTDSGSESRTKTLSPFSTEVWTWGSNFCGQLGHGDFIDRREPSRVDRLSDANVVKIVAGDEHTAVLTATGEVFVWGSNNGGQLKKADQPAVSVPILFKVGSQSSVLDVAAGPSYTSLIVNGIDSTPIVYFCGKSSNGNVDAKTTTCRLSVDKVG